MTRLNNLIDKFTVSQLVLFLVLLIAVTFVFRKSLIESDLRNVDRDIEVLEREMEELAVLMRDMEDERGDEIGGAGTGTKKESKGGDPMKSKKEKDV